MSGLVSIGSVWFAGKYLGASTTFVRATAAVEQAVMPERAATLEYLVKTAPKMDWQAWFLVGIFIGSLTAAALFGTSSSSSFRRCGRSGSATEC